jgi:hypothetical protein
LKYDNITIEGFAEHILTTMMMMMMLLLLLLLLLLMMMLRAYGNRGGFSASSSTWHTARQQTSTTLTCIHHPSPQVLDFKRILLFALWGSFGFTPMGYQWYNFIEATIPQDIPAR